MGLIDLSDSAPKFIEEKILGAYRFHSFTDGSFLVFKEDESKHSYRIDPAIGCDCPASMYRGAPCKHEKLIGFERGGHEGPPEEGDGASELSTDDDLFSFLD